MWYRGCDSGARLHRQTWYWIRYGWPVSDRKHCWRLSAAHWKADKRLGFQAGAPAAGQHIPAVGHPVAVESSHDVPDISPLHHLSAADPPGNIQINSEAQHCETIGRPGSSTYRQCNHNRRRTGSGPPEHQVGWIGWHASGRCTPILGSYVNVLSILSIYVFYECEVLHWKMLVLDREAISSGGLQPTDLEISLILVGAEQ